MTDCINNKTTEPKSLDKFHAKSYSTINEPSFQAKHSTTLNYG